ncbi:hypothetical protein ACETAC_01290 [Aceticella autotrophica]|uniref:Uncharacterized protein n=1 Tax=Aceticella autotrophica TaxID=2755338 RepID=A0A975GAN3_9THEO|nr:hypothetical protein [Aceticella autotrophica]QSZ27578.1 hypothetical protein ACETAC_01290 [Aceticella autotrophica]
MAHINRKYFIFRTDIKNRSKLYEELINGRLRQGWGIPGTSIVDKFGNIIDKNNWIENYKKSAKKLWNVDITDKDANIRYDILSLMLQIKPNDVIIVPKMPTDQTFIIAIAENGYSFEPLKICNNDFGHIIYVFKKYIKSFTYDDDINTYIISSKFKAYQAAINNIKNTTVINAIERLLEKTSSKRDTYFNSVFYTPKIIVTLKTPEKIDSIVYKAADKILKMINFKKDLDFFNRDDDRIIFSPEFEKKLEEMHPTIIEEVLDGKKPEGERKIDDIIDDILGYYVPMSSPGKIVLRWERIGCLFWHIIFKSSFIKTQLQYSFLENIAILFVLNTYIHEQFHNFCDVCRHLFSTKFDRNTEEALAVAWSYIKLNEMKEEGNNEIDIIPDNIFYDIMKRIYSYNQNGYKDWIYYQTKTTFEQGICRYLLPKSANCFSANDINIGEIIMKLNEPILYEGNVLKLLEP